MPGLSDYELMKTTDDPPPARGRVWFWGILAVLLLSLAAVVLYLRFQHRLAVTPAPARTEAPARPARPLGGEAEAIALPPLNESDALVREMVKKISSHPRVAAWLATEDLIRSFTIGVANVAQGDSASRQLTMLRPASDFRVIKRGNDLAIDPRSYARYDSLAAAVSSLDAAGTARLYATLKPRIGEAARELGDSSFDKTLERALVQLLSAPTVNDPILVQSKGIGYGFADPKLESLTNAQKHLLRTGPRNAAAVQQSLRDIALALGIPEERIPRH
jgi:hypothetical protein